MSATVYQFNKIKGESQCVRHPAVINGFSDLILELYGPEAGQHARSAVGMASLPFGIPVEIEGKVEILSQGGTSPKQP